MCKISVILPTYNEIEGIEEMYHQLKHVINELKLDYEIIFVDDNSPDGTIDKIKKLHDSDDHVKYLSMSRRYGDQISLVAGLEYSEGDAAIIMDSDLQHPPKYIPEMIGKWKQGFDIVMMKRIEAGHNSLFKKITEIFFYKILSKLSKTPIYYRFSGFALLDAKVVQALRRFTEREPFVRGLIAIVGFNKTELPYHEENRKFGKTKYDLFNLIKLAVTGITSFSETPLYLSLYVGLGTILLSVPYVFLIVYKYFFMEISIEGWASLILAVIFFGGLQLITMGLLGIYIGKIFVEIKKRPKYIVAQSCGFKTKPATER